MDAQTRILRKKSPSLLCYKYRTVRRETTGHPVSITERMFLCGTARRQSYFIRKANRYDITYFRSIITIQTNFNYYINS